MALAGRLIVALEAQTSAFESNMDRAQGKVRNFSRGGKQDLGEFKLSFDNLLGSSLKWLAGVATLTAVYQGLKRAVTDSVQAAIEFEKAQIRLEAVIRATGGAAGVTARQIDDFSSKMQATTLFSDEDVKNAASSLLAFKNINKGIFFDVLKISADFAASYGDDIESATQKIARAMSDPGEGLGMLERKMGKFDTTFKDHLKLLNDTGREVEAQKLLYDKLAGSIGGVAVAMNTGLVGATDSLSDAWADYTEELGRSPLVNGALEAAGNFIARKIQEDVAALKAMREALAGPGKHDAMAVKPGSADLSMGFGPPAEQKAYDLEQATLRGETVAPALLDPLDAYLDKILKKYDQIEAYSNKAPGESKFDLKRIAHDEGANPSMDPSVGGQTMLEDKDLEWLKDKNLANEEEMGRSNQVRFDLLQELYENERTTRERIEREDALAVLSKQSTAMSIASIMGSLASLVDGKSRKQFELSKKFALAETIISTIVSAQKAYESMSRFGPIAAVAAATAATLAGLARFNTINSTQFGGGGSAGTGGGGGNGGGNGNGNTTENGIPIGTAQQPATNVTIYIQGLADAYVVEKMIIPILSDKINNADFTIIDSGSRQAANIRENA